jgi:hypothetical protein
MFLSTNQIGERIHTLVHRTNHRRYFRVSEAQRLIIHSFYNNINDIETNMSQTYIVINEYKKVYQPRTNFVNDDIGDLLTDFHNIFGRFKN